jgi:hypothetical protein
MAKVTYGEFVTNMSGSVGGTVHSRNKGGSYTKNKVIPSNTYSSFKAAVKATFGSLSQAWRNLTEAQRIAWNSATGNYQVIDVLGKLITLSGINLYKSLNQNLATISVAAISTPPMPQGTSVTTFTSLAVDVSDVAIDVTMSAVVPANMKQVIEATPPMSAGIFNANNKFRVLSVVDAAGAAAQDVGAAYVTRFGAIPPAGSKIFVRVRYVNKTTGESSTYSSLSAISVA